MSSKFTVEFRIYGHALDPDAVTELLALKPCQVVLPGSRRGSRIVGEAMWAFNGSEDGEGGSPEWTTLEEGLKSVLEKLWSRRDLIAQYNGAHRLRDGRFRFTAELTSDLLPKEATGKQVTDLVVGYLRDHPDARQYVVAQEVTLALVKAFPCKK